MVYLNPPPRNPVFVSLALTIAPGQSQPDLTNHGFSSNIWKFWRERVAIVDMQNSLVLSREIKK